jgi:NADH-quinone oxidoreductase subunit J
VNSTNPLLLPILAAPPAGELVILGVAGLLAAMMALFAVTRRNPLYGAVFLIAFFISISLIYFRLAAPFVGIMQILVYAGAIMVLYTFIIMLLDLSPTGEKHVMKRPPGEQPVADDVTVGTSGVGTGSGMDGGGIDLKAFVISFAIFLCLAVPVVLASGKGFFTDTPSVPGDYGSVAEVGKSMYGKYALPFEIVGVLLLTAAISGVVLAKRFIADHAEDTHGLGRGLAS